MKTIKASILVDRPVTEEVVDEAIERGLLSQKNTLQATAVAYAEPCLIISFKEAAVYCCQ